MLISGSGRTLKNFIDLAAEGELPIDIRLVVSSTAKAGGLQYAEAAGIPTLVVNRSDFPHGARGRRSLRRRDLRRLPRRGRRLRRDGRLPEARAGAGRFRRPRGQHSPGADPAFCGPGMYGHHVHQAVLDAGVKVTGCTVHFVDNEYDHGPIIWQQPVPVFDDDTADTLAARVFEAEKEAYPHVLKLLAAGRVSSTAAASTIRKPPRGDRQLARQCDIPID